MLMEPTLFDAVTVASSDSSLPQTPSPRSSISLDHPFAVKPAVDFPEPLEPHAIFSEARHHYPECMENEPVTHSIDGHGFQHSASTMTSSVHGSPFFIPQRTSGTGVPLRELNDQDYIDSMEH